MGRNQLENAVASLRSMVAVPAKDQNDRELIRAYLSNNDQVAFAALVKRYGPLVLVSANVYPIGKTLKIASRRRSSYLLNTQRHFPSEPLWQDGCTASPTG